MLKGEFLFLLLHSKMFETLKKQHKFAFIIFMVRKMTISIAKSKI